MNIKKDIYTRFLQHIMFIVVKLGKGCRVKWFSDAISVLFQKRFIFPPMNFAQFGRHNVVYIVKI